MAKPNTVNYRTDQSRVSNFQDFNNNVKEEEEELKDMDRNYLKNDNNIGNLANKDKFKYNKVTRKMDTMNQDEVKDSIEAIEEIKENIILNFEKYAKIKY